MKRPKLTEGEQAYNMPGCVISEHFYQIIHIFLKYTEPESLLKENMCKISVISSDDTQIFAKDVYQIGKLRKYYTYHN